MKIARGADVAIVIVGNHPTCNAGWAKCPLPSDGKEAIDRQSITLEQEEIVKQVYAVNPRTVEVLISSFPFAIAWSQENVPAILHMAHNSQEEGNALADALFGDYNPGGRLVTTWPMSSRSIAADDGLRHTHGRTYMYFKQKPLYPFGYGLSYTTFEYSNLRTSSDRLGRGGEITVSVDVRNTGERAGEEVVQMYVAHLNSKVARPGEELKGFQRITLRAGRAEDCAIAFEGERAGILGCVAKGSFEVEADQVSVMVGSSSADIKLKKSVEVE